MILAYAGRRAETLPEDTELVSQRLRRLLTGLQPTSFVGAAADGGDLLVLEAALALREDKEGRRPTAHVVLPTRRDVFRENSVEPGWRWRFDAVLDEVESRGGTVQTLSLEPGDE